MIGRISAAAFEAEGLLCCGCTKFDGTFVLVSTCDIVPPVFLLSSLVTLTGFIAVLRAMQIRCKQEGSARCTVIFPSGELVNIFSLTS